MQDRAISAIRPSRHLGATNAVPSAYAVNDLDIKASRDAMQNY